MNFFGVTQFLILFSYSTAVYFFLHIPNLYLCIVLYPLLLYRAYKFVEIGIDNIQSTEMYRSERFGIATAEQLLQTPRKAGRAGPSGHERGTPCFSRERSNSQRKQQEGWMRKFIGGTNSIGQQHGGKVTLCLRSCISPRASGQDPRAALESAPGVASRCR